MHLAELPSRSRGGPVRPQLSAERQDDRQQAPARRLGDAATALVSQPADDPDRFASALAARLQRPWQAVLALAQGAHKADDPDTIVWTFEALTGRSAAAAERLDLLAQIEARQRPPC